MRYLRHLVAVLAATGMVTIARAEPPPDAPRTDEVNTPPPAENLNRVDETPPPAPTPPPPTVVVMPPAQPPPVIVVQPRKKGCWESKAFSPCQISFTFGGGAVDFVSDQMASAVQTGAAWDARVTVGTRSILALEAGYMGTLNRLEGAQSNEPYLMSNSVDSDLRINLLPWRVEPYVFGGVGWNNMHLGNADADPAMAARFRTWDNQLLVPAGGGLSAYLFRHATLDARFTYRAMFNQNILVANPGERADQWTVLGRLGYAF